MAKLVFILGILFTLAFLPIAAFAQEEDIENLQVGIQTGTQLLADIPVSHFEDADSWTTVMPIDEGIVMSMRRRGRPLEVPENDPNDNSNNRYVLGVKVAFNQRGYNHFTVRPARPIKIPGITKALSVWVCGRSFKHRLYVHVLDYKGSPMMLDMGPLDFVGWKKVAIPIPATIEQDNYHNTEWRGISLMGMSIQCDPEEAYGVYYVYFDEMRAISDIYSEEYMDEDDMQDGW
jgi:hypothetical protein